jgi:glyoxylate reductase
MVEGSGLVVVTRALPPEAAPFLRDLERDGYDVRIIEQGRPIAAWLLRRQARPAVGLLPMVTDRVDARLMEDARRLRVISNFGVGVNNIDVVAATRLGIVVCNTPGVLDDATADCAWALILALARRVTWGDDYVRQGLFPGWGPLEAMGWDVTGQTLGIVGLGRIGRAVARRARAFSMRVLYTQRNAASPAVEAELQVTRVSFESLLRESDFVSLHCPYTPSTHHLIDAEALLKMKPSAFLINTTRGAVVDEASLVRALRRQTIAGAGLDVYEREPRLAPGLNDCDNAILLPHVGSATPRTRGAMATLAGRNLVQALAGHRPDHCVNPEVLSSPALRR